MRTSEFSYLSGAVDVIQITNLPSCLHLFSGDVANICELGYAQLHLMKAVKHTIFYCVPTGSDAS